MALSRWGKPYDILANLVEKTVECVATDCADEDQLMNTLAEHGPFDAYVHATGLLHDMDSGLGQVPRCAQYSCCVLRRP